MTEDISTNHLAFSSKEHQPDQKQMRRRHLICFPHQPRASSILDLNEQLKRNGSSLHDLRAKSLKVILENNRVSFEFVETILKENFRIQYNYMKVNLHLADFLSMHNFYSYSFYIQCHNVLYNKFQK